MMSELLPFLAEPLFITEVLSGLQDIKAEIILSVHISYFNNSWLPAGNSWYTLMMYKVSEV